MGFKVIKEEIKICELCGDPLGSDFFDGGLYALTELDSEYFGLDTGTELHYQCFYDSRPPSYIKEIRQQEAYESWCCEDDSDYYIDW